MKDFFSIVYKAFIVASVISFVISLFSSGEVSYGSSITGYSVLTLGIMMILIIIIQNILKITEGQSIIKIILEVFISCGPLLLLLGITGFMLYLIINYKSLIISGHVSSNYYSFTNITIILLLLQVYIIYSNIDSQKNQGRLNKVTSCLLYLLAILTTTCSIVIFTILKYFTTDGFTSKIN
jgi:hypothetical protein